MQLEENNSTRKDDVIMAKLFVIAGHGAGDPGACGNGYSEAERVRALASRIKAYGGNYVMVGDTNRNWYADNGISKLDISKDYQILELHMDSGVSSARGGHVIINGKYNADKYDTALASMISSIFPGRAKTIVGRTDLANPNRAARKGYGYRLMECGFISNANDVDVFNSRIDDVAKGILSAFGIIASGTTSAKPTVAPSPSKPAPSSGKIAVDGKWGQATTRKAQQVFGTVQDGIISNQPYSNRMYLPNAFTTSWQFKTGGYSQGSNLIRAIQNRIGAKADGFFGPKSVKKLQHFLGVKDDGSMGPATVMAFQTWLNKF